MSKKQVIILLLFVFVIILVNNFITQFFNVPLRLKMSSELESSRRRISSQALFDYVWIDVKQSYFDHTMNGQKWRRWKDHYRGKIHTDEDAKVAINTMLSSLNDPYSNYMNREEYMNQTMDINASVTGIGVNISSIDGKITVVGVIEGSPAQSSQILENDIIYKVDGVETSGMPLSDVAQKVRGKEGSIVELKILRGDKKLTKKIKRKVVMIKSVKSSVDKEIGYIQIMSFIGTSTSKEFLDALHKTDKTKGLIIDLRGNSGGLLPNAVFITSLFLNKGDDLVSIVGRGGYKKVIKASDVQYKVDKPVVVLVDGLSASASEIFSGAMKDYHRATIIGTNTFGKGMVQEIVPLPNLTGMNLTIAKYLTPNGIDINHKGIVPDVKVELTLDDVKKKNDKQLLVAKQELRKLIDN